jgi:GNAT superfamily N-acetyltransferase
VRADVFVRAEPADIAGIAALRVATARDLTERYGRGHWSGETTERSVAAQLRSAYVWVARRGRAVVATFQLSPRKPWAIDRRYFSAAERPLYLTNIAVRPDLQGGGIGRRALAAVVQIAAAWPADAIRLDAYDAAAGAGVFYGKCGFREVGRVVYRGVPLIYYEQQA